MTYPTAGAVGYWHHWIPEWVETVVETKVDLPELYSYQMCLFPATRVCSAVVP